MDNLYLASLYLLSTINGPFRTHYCQNTQSNFFNIKILFIAKTCLFLNYKAIRLALNLIK